MQCPLQFILQLLLTLFFFLVDYANDSGALVVPGQIPWDSPPGSTGISFAGAQDDDVKMPSNNAGNESPTGNILEDSRNEEDLSLPRLRLLDTLRECGAGPFCTDYLQNTSDHSVDIVKRVIPDVIHVCKSDSNFLRSSRQMSSLAP